MKNKTCCMDNSKLFEEFIEELGHYLKCGTDIGVECDVEYEATEKVINVTVNIYA